MGSGRAHGLRMQWGGRTFRFDRTHSMQKESVLAKGSPCPAGTGNLGPSVTRRGASLVQLSQIGRGSQRHSDLCYT